MHCASFHVFSNDNFLVTIQFGEGEQHVDDLAHVAAVLGALLLHRVAQEHQVRQEGELLQVF